MYQTLARLMAHASYTPVQKSTGRFGVFASDICPFHSRTRRVTKGALFQVHYACSDWTIPVFGSEYPNTDISRQNFFLNNYCGYFLKEIFNGFLCLDTLIQTLGKLLNFRKAKNTRLAARVFLRFSQVSQHPACLDHEYPNTEILHDVRGKYYRVG